MTGRCCRGAEHAHTHRSATTKNNFTHSSTRNLSSQRSSHPLFTPSPPSVCQHPTTQTFSHLSQLQSRRPTQSAAVRLYKLLPTCLRSCRPRATLIRAKVNQELQKKKRKKEKQYVIHVQNAGNRIVFLLKPLRGHFPWHQLADIRGWGRGTFFLAAVVH